MPETTFTLDQVTLILQEAQKLAYEQGKNYAQTKIGDYLERLVDYPCMKPNWAQIASDIRAGQVVYND